MNAREICKQNSFSQFDTVCLHAFIETVAILSRSMCFVHLEIVDEWPNGEKRQSLTTFEPSMTILVLTKNGK